MFVYPLSPMYFEIASEVKKSKPDDSKKCPSIEIPIAIPQTPNIIIIIFLKLNLALIIPIKIIIGSSKR